MADLSRSKLELDLLNSCKTTEEKCILEYRLKRLAYSEVLNLWRNTLKIWS